MESKISGFQVAVARSVLSFSRANSETQAQLLETYRAIPGLDEELDDRRRGQAEALNRGVF